MVHSSTTLPLRTHTKALDSHVITTEVLNLPVPSVLVSRRTVHEGQHCALECSCFVPAQSTCHEAQDKITSLLIPIPFVALDSRYFLCDLLLCSAYNCLVRKSDSQFKDLSFLISAAPLGSIAVLPGKSCSEIKASEGKAMTDGIHWIYSDENLDQAIKATCEGNSLGINQLHIAIS